MCGQLMLKLNNPLMASIAEDTASFAPLIAPEMVLLIPSQTLDTVPDIAFNTFDTVRSEERRVGKEC